MLQRNNIDYIKDILLKNDELQVVSYNDIKNIPSNDLLLFMHERGIYCLPTKELIEFLQTEIDGEMAVEIGAGHGAIGRQLGIISTDSYLQQKQSIQKYYAIMQQPVVKYGVNVLKYDAIDAIYKFQPHTVVGAFITHKYSQQFHYHEGNVWGVDERKLLSKVKKYIFIGNEYTHNKKIIKQLNPKFRTLKFDWLVTRCQTPSMNCIWIWE